MRDILPRNSVRLELINMLKKPREKGRRLELRIAQKLRDSGIDKFASRTPLSGGGSIKGDIITKCGLTIECKNVEKINFIKHLNKEEFC